MDDSLARGFSTATIIPAIASTFKQAQREAADALHVLADYRSTADGRDADSPLSIGGRQREAARRVGVVLAEQGINGTAFFLAVTLSVGLAGPVGGMLAQLAITGNTMVTPGQTQAFNPARLLTARLWINLDWVALLDDRPLAAFAYHAGGLARACGYGKPGQEMASDRPNRFFFRC